jgi:chromosome segregation ATPase
MELFPTEFPQGEENVQPNESEAVPTPNHHDSPQLEHPVASASAASIPPESGAGTPEQDIPLRGKAATHGLTAEEKKERQKQQNRRAAERSRNKKREEVYVQATGFGGRLMSFRTALEMTVNNIQDENNRLRARLAALVAVKPDTVQPDGDAANVSSSSIDISTLSRLQGELAAAKATLLERELELGRMGSPATQTPADTDDTRHTLVSRTSALQEAQSEVRALNTVINELRTEHESLNRRRDVVTRELELRRSLQGSPGESAALSPANSRASGVERTLLELRGLVDGVIKTWEQVRTSPGFSVGGY